MAIYITVLVSIARFILFRSVRAQITPFRLTSSRGHLQIITLFSQRYSQVIIVIRVLLIGSSWLLGDLLSFAILSISILEYVFPLSLLLCGSELFFSSFLFFVTIFSSVSRLRDHDVVMVVFCSSLVDGGTISICCLAFLQDLLL